MWRRVCNPKHLVYPCFFTLKYCVSKDFSVINVWACRFLSFTWGGYFRVFVRKRIPIISQCPNVMFFRYVFSYLLLEEANFVHYCWMLGFAWVCIVRFYMCVSCVYVGNMFGLDEKAGEIYGFLPYPVQHLKLITLILLPMKKWKAPATRLLTLF